jgi:DNA-binding CsgD family transcriptional regulator
MADKRVPLGSSYITQAEQKILALAAKGMSIRKIAEKLGKDFRTVITQMRIARERLNLGTNFQLVALYAASNHTKGRDRSSNRAAVTDLRPGTAPSRGL